MKVNNENTILHPFTFIMEMPLGVPQDVKGQPLLINQLKGNPLEEDCSISNVHQCKKFYNKFYDGLIKIYKY